MPPTASSSQDSQVRSEVRRIWDANAEYWDRSMGEGNMFHRQLLLPSIERLLQIKEGMRVLDVACGNGQLSRWMSERGANVVAVDISEKMIGFAHGRGNPGPGTISYQTVDASEPGALEKLGHQSFDATICNMALMDMPDIEPLAKAIPALIGSGGKFVFSVTHPCFNTSDMRKVASESMEGGTARVTYGVEVRRYLTQRSEKGMAFAGQPEPQLYFERPISSLLGVFLRHGMVLNAFEEPAFSNTAKGAAGDWFNWQNFKDIPPVIVVCLIPS